MQRITCYPLYGANSALPPLTSVQSRLLDALFQSGGRYLGDEDSMVRAAAAPAPGGPSLPAQWSGVGSTRSFPWIELAVMGRSNAGKSTLLNALLSSKPHAAHSLKSFVPVSRTPGTTVRLDFYGVGSAETPSLVLVDTPGYGFSIRGKGRHGVWMERMAEYLRTRRTMSSGPAASPLLARVMVLADARLGLTELDHGVLQALDDSRLPCHVVLTKADLVGTPSLTATVQATARALRGYKMPFPHLNVVSGVTGEGMRELCSAMMHTSKLHRLSAADFEQHSKELSESAARLAAAGPTPTPADRPTQ